MTATTLAQLVTLLALLQLRAQPAETALSSVHISLLLTYQNTQASGADFDMVMSTKEQGAFETALVTPASLDSIKAGLSKVDVCPVPGFSKIRKKI